MKKGTLLCQKLKNFTKFKKMNTILITGVCGFIGTELTEFFTSRNFNVIGIDIKNKNDRLASLKNGYTHYIVDLYNREEINLLFNKIIYPNLIIHLAGITRVKEAALSPHRAIAVNILSTVNVFLSYQKYSQGASKKGSFLFISTSELENTSTSGGKVSVYSITKNCAEELIKSIQDPQILSTSILRLCTVYGGEMELKDKLPRIFLEKIKINQQIEINSDIKINPSFIFIKDLLLIIEKITSDLLNTEKNNFVLETYTVLGEEASLGEIISLMEDIISKSIDHIYLHKYRNEIDESHENITYHYKTIRANNPVKFSEGLKVLWNIVNRN